MKKRDEDSWQKYRDKDRMREKKKKTAAQSSELSCAARRGEALLEMQTKNDTLEVAVFK